MDLGGGHNLVLTTTFVRNDPDRRRAERRGTDRCWSSSSTATKAVNAKYEELIAAGYRGRRPPFRTDFEAWMALVDDPDGNTVLVTAG